MHGRLPLRRRAAGHQRLQVHQAAASTPVWPRGQARRHGDAHLDRGAGRVGRR